MITDFDFLIVKCQLFMTIDLRGLPCDNYHLSSVTVIIILRRPVGGGGGGGGRGGVFINISSKSAF